MKFKFFECFFSFYARMCKHLLTRDGTLVNITCVETCEGFLSPGGEVQSLAGVVETGERYIGNGNKL